MTAVTTAQGASWAEGLWRTNKRQERDDEPYVSKPMQRVEEAHRVGDWTKRDDDGGGKDRS